MSNSSVAENQAIGTAVGTFSTTDPDSGNTFVYGLVSGTGSTDNGSFTIEDNTLKTNAVFNYETKPSYSIRVRTTDQGGLYYEEAFTIMVTDVAENSAPTDISLSNSSVAENQAIGTAIGTFNSIDPDSGNTFIYSMVSGTGSTDNGAFTIEDNILKTNAIFNYETKSSYRIRVRTTDQGGLYYDKIFTIMLINLNEAPVFANVGNKTVNKGVALDFIVSAIDPDGDNLTYMATNLPIGANFNTSTQTFTWTPTDSQTGTYDNIHFEVSDGNLADIADITITVNNGSGSNGGGGGGGGGGSSLKTTTKKVLSPGYTDVSNVVNARNIFTQTTTLQSNDGLVKLIITKGTQGHTLSGKLLTEIALLTMDTSPILPNNRRAKSPLYICEPTDTIFSQPVVLSLTYNTDTTEPEVLTIATWNSETNNWTELDSIINAKNNTISANISSLSVFTVLAEILTESTAPLDISVTPVASVAATINFAPITKDTFDFSEENTHILDEISSGVESSNNNQAPVISTSLEYLDQSENKISAASDSPDAQESVYSLSILAKVIGGALIFIGLMTGFILLRRRKMMHYEANLKH